MLRLRFCFAPPRNFDTRECTCEKAYKQMFPGKTMKDKGPCQHVFTSDFKSGSCDSSKAYKGLSCPFAAAQMIADCTQKMIPNVPPNNPTAGTLFDSRRAELVKAAYEKAGCPIAKELRKLGITVNGQP